MKRTRFESVLLAQPNMDRLKDFLLALNSRSFGFDLPPDRSWKIVRNSSHTVQRELRLLVQAWFDSGPNVKALFRSNAVLASAAQDLRAVIVANEGPTARLKIETIPVSMNAVEPLTIAHSLFLDFLLNPFNTRLGGPCAHCNQYFIRNDLRQKVYCSKRCGRKHTALEVNRNRRAREHRDKLEKAQISIAKWVKARTRADWKDWVSKDPTISKNWLTRRVNSDELIEPIR